MYINKSRGGAPAMERRHFKMIAEILLDARADRELINRFAFRLAGTNENFRTNDFRSAAGYYESYQGETTDAIQ